MARKAHPPEISKPVTRKQSASEPAIGKPGDRHEQEAERVADGAVAGRQVLPSTGAAVQQAEDHTSAPPLVDQVLESPGSPLDPAARGQMEARLGHSFADVRIHADPRAADSARAVGARAYTVGSEIVFGAGQYAPQTDTGKRLLAHELAHVVQQDGATGLLQRDQAEELVAKPATTAYRALPPQVAQSSTWSCWAAAMESWLSVTPGRTKMNEAELISWYATNKSNGALDPLTGWPDVATDFKMDYSVIAGSSLTQELIATKLRDKGHIVLAYNLGSGGASHANVVYGIGYPDGKELRVSVMDPNGGGYANRPLSDFTSVSAMIVAWPK